MKNTLEISLNKIALTRIRGQCKHPIGFKSRVTSRALTTLHAQSWPGWTRGFWPQQLDRSTRIFRIKNTCDLNTFRLMKRDVIRTAKGGTRCLCYTWTVLNKSGRKQNCEGVIQGKCENARVLVRLRYLGHAKYLVTCIRGFCYIRPLYNKILPYYKLKPMFSFGKWWKLKSSLIGFVYRVIWVLKALSIFLSETINFLRKLHISRTSGWIFIKLGTGVHHDE